MRFVPEGFAPSAGARGAAPEPARRGAGGLGGIGGGPGGSWGAARGRSRSVPSPLLRLFWEVSPPRPAEPGSPQPGGSGAPPQPPRGSQPGGTGRKRREREGPGGERGDGGERPRCCRARGGPAGLGAAVGAAPPGRGAGRGGGTAASRSPALPERLPRGAGEPALPSLLASIHPCLLLSLRAASLRSGSGGEVAAGAPAGAAEGGGGAGERRGRPGARCGGERRGCAGGGCGRARLKTLWLGTSRLRLFFPFSSPSPRSLHLCEKLRRNRARSRASRSVRRSRAGPAASFVRLGSARRGSVSAAPGRATLLSLRTRRSSPVSKRSRSPPHFSFCLS